MIQLALLVVVHAHPVDAVTATLPDELAAGTLAEVDPIVGVQAAPACVTVYVLPATVSVPVREVLAVLAVPEYATEPLLAPEAPAVMEIHDALLTAVQVQPLPAVTDTAPVNAAAATLAEAGEIVGEHELAACVIVKVLPPIVSVPVRLVEPGLAVPV